MSEVNILIQGKLIEYEGLIDVSGLIKLLDMWFKERRYFKREMKNFEEVFEDGRQATIEMFPYKPISDNLKFEMRLFMVFSKMQDTEIEKNGKKVKMLKGKATISMDGYLITDYEGKWDKTPFYYFMRVIFDKYFYKNYIGRAKAEFMEDAATVENEIRAYLNMMRFVR